jgi:hypothetical protein
MEVLEYQGGSGNTPPVSPPQGNNGGNGGTAPLMEEVVVEVRRIFWCAGSRGSRYWWSRWSRFTNSITGSSVT